MLDKLYVAESRGIIKYRTDCGWRWSNQLHGSILVSFIQEIRKTTEQFSVGERRTAYRNRGALLFIQEKFYIFTSFSRAQVIWNVNAWILCRKMFLHFFNVLRIGMTKYSETYNKFMQEFLRLGHKSSTGIKKEFAFSVREYKSNRHDIFFIYF